MHTSVIISAITMLASQALSSSVFLSAFKGSCTPLGTYQSDDHADYETSSSGDMGCYSFYQDIGSFRPWQLEENGKRMIAWGDDDCVSAENMIEVTVSKECYTAPADVSNYSCESRALGF